MEKFCGYAGKRLEIDLSAGRVDVVPLERSVLESYLGGRGTDAKTIFDRMKKGQNPSSPSNVFCVSTGCCTGLLGPTAGRVNIASISPLTGIYANSNAGTNWGPQLKYAGYDGVVLCGRAASLCYILIDDDRVEIRDADFLKGKGVFDTTLALKERHGDDFNIAAVGPAAERGVLFGSVVFDYWDASGRGGLGTVMASKNVKAIAVRGTGALEVADGAAYLDVVREAWRGILEEPGFLAQEHPALGTAICVNWGNAQGWLPTRNFRESHFESAHAISGEEFRDAFSTRRSPLPGGRACMSCPNRCKRFGRIDSGKYAGTRGNIEFEGIAAFGSKCGVGELDAVFHAFMLANDYGMDCVSAGNMIATFMELNEEGLLPAALKKELDLRFGDADSMVEAVHRIANRDGKLGELGALGAYEATRRIGGKASYFTSCVKKLDTIACDPRVAKGFGFTYAIASRGSDHLRTHPVYEMLNMPPEVSREMFGDEEASQLRAYGGKVRMVVWHEELAAVTDSVGTCRFMHASYYAQYPIPELLHKYGRKRREPHSIKYHQWITAATGITMDYESMLEIGRRIVTLERAINLRLGVRRRDDRLPERFHKEKVPSGPAAGEVFDRKRFTEMLNEYYDIRGWDRKRGLIKRKTLKELRMEDVLAVLEKERLVV